MKPPRRVYLSSIDVSVGRLFICDPEMLDRLTPEAVLQSTRQRGGVHQYVDENGVSTIRQPAPLVGEYRDALDAFSICAPQSWPTDEQQRMGVSFPTKPIDKVMVFGDVAADGISIKSVSAWLGFTGCEELIEGICLASELDYEVDARWLGALFYQYQIDLEDYSDPAVAIKALEFAVGTPIEVIKQTPWLKFKGC